MRRVDFLVGKAEDESSDAKDSLFGISGSEGRVIRYYYKIYISHNIICSKSRYIYTIKYREVFTVFHRRTEEL
jgi:hypothetical protein